VTIRFIIPSIIFYYIEEAIKKMDNEKSNEVFEEGVLRKLLKIDKNMAVILVGDLLLAGVDTVRSENFTHCF
jgi:cytochrome P450 family 12